LRRRAEEGFPVEILLVRLRVNRVVPLAALVDVAPEAARGPDDLTDQAVPDRLLRLVEMIHRGVLAADLQDAPARFDSFGDLSGLINRVGHRLLKVDIL